MIQLGNQEQLDGQRKRVKEQIAATYSNAEIAKAMDMTTFQEKYPTEKYEIFSEKAVEKFREDFMKSEDANSELLEQNVGLLEKVSVTDGEVIANVYIREKPQE